MGMIPELLYPLEKASERLQHDKHVWDSENYSHFWLQAQWSSLIVYGLNPTRQSLEGTKNSEFSTRCAL